MRNIVITFLLITSATLFGQSNTIVVRRNDSLPCDFRFIADTSLVGKTFRLSHIKLVKSKKLKRKTIKRIVNKIKFQTGLPIIVMKEVISDLFKDVCEEKGWKLNWVKVALLDDTNYVSIKASYKKDK